MTRNLNAATEQMQKDMAFINKGKASSDVVYDVDKSYTADVKDDLPSTRSAPLDSIPRTKPAPTVKDPNKERVITLTNNNIPVSIVMNIGSSKPLTINVKAWSAECTDDNIVLLLDNAYEMNIPALSEFDLIVNDVTHKVTYVGGAHKFYSFSVMTFIKIQ